ncbi:MAG: carbohydrate porin [Gammaproteobacteria bacterium]|nr:carbohydrate porin [Gammaproteobacteria bacterium]
MAKLITFLTLILLSCQALAVDIVTGQHSLQFHGYFRSSLGLSEAAENQPLFQLPGARSKYRLGNEPETNMELQFDYRHELKQPDNSNANIMSVIMLDGFKRQGESNDFEVGHLSQAYISFNKLFNNDVDIWFGRRYYQRKSIHIMNHFWLNPGQNSHAGFGFEHMPLASGRLDLALFRNEDDFTLVDVQYLINSTVVDARWQLAVAENASITLWLQQAQRNAEATLNYDVKSGYSAGGWYDHKSSNATNTTALLYMTGAAITQSGTSPWAIREDQGWVLDEAKVIEISNVLSYEILPHYSLQWSLLYREDDRGSAGNSLIKWSSTGIRPVFYLSKHTSVALEAGVDYVDDEVNNRSGRLNKFTAALQIAADRGFKSRPVLRFFVTQADWSDDFIGLVGHEPGNAPYADVTSGWVIGAQVEAWW